MTINVSAFCQLKPNIALFKNLPASICYQYMQLIGKLYYLLKRKEKRLITSNIRDLLQGKSEGYIKSITKQTFKGIFSHYFEKMISAFKDVHEIKRFVTKKVSIQNEEIIKEALGLGKGVILVTAHWGAVEFIPWVLGFKGYPVSVILECQTQHLERALTKQAKHYDAELINCSGTSSVFYDALKSLSNNRLLMTECDEVDTWRKKKSQTIQLFGKCLFFDNTLDILARRSEAPVVGVFLKRVSRSSYELICESISIDKSGAGTARNAFGLWQKYVTQHPEQWYQWKKWKHMKVAS